MIAAVQLATLSQVFTIDRAVVGVSSAAMNHGMAPGPMAKPHAIKIIETRLRGADRLLAVYYLDASVVGTRIF